MDNIRIAENLRLKEFAGLSVLLLIISFGIFAIAGHVFENNAIAALTAFGTALTGFTSLVLVGIYLKQTQIFRQHGEILESQKELMELSYIPDLCCTSTACYANDTVSVSLSNIAEGYAHDIRLTVQLEFEGSFSYASPITGHSSLSKTNTDGQHGRVNSLAPNETGEFEAPAILTIEDDHRRNFENIVDDLAAEDVTKLRVSLTAEAKNSAGEYITSCPLMDEDHFYADLERCESYDLEAVYKCSSPAQ